ncbi:MAG: inositol monophosphatase family protein [Chlamydiota bacterium]
MSQIADAIQERAYLALQIALKAGALLRTGFGSSFSIREKEGRHNLVTDYDHLSEEMILSSLQKAFPHDRFLAEERGSFASATGEFEWVIDPLDGTVNFAHTVPVFAVSIGCRHEGELSLGVIYQPITQEIFTAQKGKGAFLNGKRLQVTKTGSLREAIVGTGFPYNLAEDPLHCIEKFSRVLKQGIPIRRLGAASIDLAYVADGRFDAFFEVVLQPWDLAAGALIVEEAGGKVTDWQGAPLNIDAHQPVLVSNGKIHAELQKILT